MVNGDTLVFIDKVAFAYVINFSVPWSPSLNTWYHVALMQGDWGNTGTATWTITIDGVPLFTDGIAVFDDNTVDNVDLSIGNNLLLPSASVTGWLDEYRISTSPLQWTEAFTPPTKAYSASPVEGKLITNEYSAPTEPTRLRVRATELLNTGTITYYGTRVASPGNDLSDLDKWIPLTLNTWVDISSLPTGNSVRVAALITGDAELEDLSFAWE